MRLLKEYSFGEFKFINGTSNDHKGYIFIKDREYFIGWIGYKGLIKGSALKYCDEYSIVGIDCWGDL